MKKLVKIITYMVAFVSLFSVIVSCSGSGGGGGGDVATGLLSIGLTDAPPLRNTYAAIYVTVEEIQVKHEDSAGWEILTGPDLNLPQTVNLLDLVGGVIADLGAVELATGHYTQMRLILGSEPDDPIFHRFANYLILEGDDENPIELKVPSGYQTGIKLVNGFDIKVEGATELVLDFDALKSVVQAGNSGKWILKPTIKVIDTVVNSVGGVINDENGVPLEGAMISAQLNSSPDGVEVANETLSDADGRYFMYLPLNRTSSPYNIVATATKTVADTEVVYDPACSQLESSEAMAYIADFMLSPSESGLLHVTIAGLPEDTELVDTVTLSIQQVHDPCGLIEVQSSTWTNEGLLITEDFTLPVGDYKIGVTLYYNNNVYFDDRTAEVTIPDTTDISFDFSIPAP